VHRVGVLLAGCGAYDGSDIHETVLAALALERARLRAVCLAMPAPQASVVDHTTGEADPGAGERSMLVESARLARGRVDELDPVSASDLAAIIVPGGLGVLRNLFEDVLVAGRSPRLRGPVADVLRGLRGRGAPVGAIGLGHAVLDALGEPLGVDPFAADPSRAWLDPDRRIGWAPGFLVARSLDEAARGIDDLVGGIGAMLAPAAGQRR
jgi:enhancing lycopene biosynthesis protein 2